MSSVWRDKCLGDVAEMSRVLHTQAWLLDMSGGMGHENVRVDYNLISDACAMLQTLGSTGIADKTCDMK